MADAADSKSAGGDIVRVQVPPSALKPETDPDTDRIGLVFGLFFCARKDKKADGIK